MLKIISLWIISAVVSIYLMSYNVKNFSLGDAIVVGAIGPVGTMVALIKFIAIDLNKICIINCEK